MQVGRQLGLPFLLAFLLAPVGALAGAGITYHGRLIKPDGTPVIANPVKFKIQIRTPGAENCLLYQETHALDMSTSDGIFAVTVNDGTATVVNTEPFPLDRTFQNRGTFTFAGGKCGTGNSYTPNPTDGRRIVVEFDDGATGGWEPLPAQTINFVPMAMEALSLGGYGSGSMLRVNDGTGAPAAISALTQTQYNNFLDLLAGTSSLFLTSSSSLNGGNLADGSVTDAKLASGISAAKISGNISGNAAGFTGSLAGDVTGTQGATSVVRLRGRDIDSNPPSNGQVLKWNAGASRWEPSADNAGSGSVTSVTGTGAVVMTGTAADPIVGVQDASTSVKGVVQLSAGGGTTAGQVVQANDSRLSDARTPIAHHHDVDEIDSAASKYFSYKPNNTACANGELLKWNLAQTRWECGSASSSEATTASNVGTAGIGVFKQLSTYDLQFKKLNAASGALSVTDDPVNNKIDIGVNAELGGLAGLSSNGFVKRTAAGTYSPVGSIGLGDMNVSGVFTNNTGLLVTDGTQLQNKACAVGETIKWLSPTGWTCAPAGIASESDPKVGANTTNALSKWNGSALVASGVFDDGTNVGIGTTTATSKLTVSSNAVLPPVTTSVVPSLHLVGADATSPGMLVDGFGGSAGLFLRRANGTAATPTPILADENLGQIVFGGYMTTAYQNNSAAKITASASENWSDTTAGGNLAFHTRPPLSLGTSQERMRIDPNGNVGIGSTAPKASLDLSLKTDAIAVPVGTAAQRPAAPAEGMLRFNTDTRSFEGYAAGAWARTATRSTQDLTFYVRTDGDDALCNGGVDVAYSAGVAPACSFASVQRAVDQIPDLISHQMTVNVRGGTYYTGVSNTDAINIAKVSNRHRWSPITPAILIQAIPASGTVTISGATSAAPTTPVTLRGFVVQGGELMVRVKDITFQYFTGQGLQVTGGSDLFIDNITSKNNSAGIQCNSSAQCYVQNTFTAQSVNNGVIIGQGANLNFNGAGANLVLSGNGGVGTGLNCSNGSSCSISQGGATISSFNNGIFISMASLSISAPVTVSSVTNVGVDLERNSAGDISGDLTVNANGANFGVYIWQGSRGLFSGSLTVTGDITYYALSALAQSTVNFSLPAGKTISLSRTTAGAAYGVVATDMSSINFDGAGTVTLSKYYYCLTAERSSRISSFNGGTRTLTSCNVNGYFVSGGHFARGNFPVASTCDSATGAYCY